MLVVPFDRAHLARIRVQAGQADAEQHMRDEAYVAAINSAESWSVLDGARVLACCGLMERWPGNAMAWALLSADIGPREMLRLHRAVARRFAVQNGRIEAYVAADFEPGHRWMRLLGFERETPGAMRKWLPNGGDAVLYAKVN